MIYIVFISPEGFLQLANSDPDHSGLRDLDSLLFPRRGIPNVLLADAHDPNWYRQLQRKVLALPENDRHYPYELLKRIKGLALVGWDTKASVPVVDRDWIKLVLSQKSSLVDCVFACEKMDSDESVEALDRLSDDEWVNDRFVDRQRVPRTQQAQAPLFQKLLLGADWCLVELPHAKGSQNDEIATLNQIIRVAKQRRHNVPIEIDFILSAGANLHNVEHHLESIPSGSGIRIRFFKDPELHDRNFIAGTVSRIAGGQNKRIPKWGMFTQHVAFGDDQSGPGNYWGLMNKSQTRTHWENRHQVIRNMKPLLSLPKGY